MEKMYINKKMLRVLRKKGYSIKNTQNGKYIKGEHGYFQIVSAEKGILILGKEVVKYCDRIYSIWPDRNKIRLKVEENEKLKNVIIRADQFCKEYGA